MTNYWLYLLNEATLSGQGEATPTSKDLQLLEMRRQGQSYDGIGEETGMDTKEVQRQISLTLKRILRDLRIDLDVPALHEPIEIH